MTVLRAADERTRAFAAARVRQQVRDLLREERSNVALLLRDLNAARDAIVARLGGGTEFDQQRARQLVAAVEAELRALRVQLVQGMTRSLTEAMSRGDADMVEQARAIVGAEMTSLAGVDPVLVEFARDNSADLVGRITEDLRSRLNTTIRSAATGAATIADVERQIGEVVDAAGRPTGVFGTAATQVDRISRTEVARLYEGAKQVREQRVARKVPYQMMKRWITVVDSRTRFEHQAMNGATVPVEEHFNYGASSPWNRMSYEEAERRGGDLGIKITGPHDSVLPAKDAVNCRCTRGMVRGPRKEE